MKTTALAAGAAVSPTTVASPGNSNRKPNILLILVDDLGWGDLSCFGTADLRTPNVDRIAAEGIRFDNFYANSCVCSPTRAAIMTGRFQEFVGVPGVIRTNDEQNWGHLIADCTLLPQILKTAGYHSTIVGKWHLGLDAPNTPTLRGFDRFRGFLGDMMDDYYNHRRHGRNYMRDDERVIDPEGHATDLFSQWAVEELEKRATADGPFFMYLAYNAPHTPIQPPEEWLRKVKQREPGLPDKRARIVALIEHLDHGIGRVLEALDRLELAGDTLVLFTSDNGGQLDVGANNGPYRSGKCHVYEGGVRVSMCARWPGRIPAGKTSDFRAMSMDLYPTFAEIAGATIDFPIEGRSFLLALQGKDQEAFERTDFYSWLERTTKEACRKGDWKLVRDIAGSPFELYNMGQDPLEERNVAEAHPEVLAELLGEMKAHIGEAAVVPWRRP